jgi:tagaturonate reductase
MEDDTMSTFITDLMQNEIAPSIPYEVAMHTAQEFGNKVLDRFRNQHIKHLWINITVQYSLKMKMRCIPVLLKHYQNNDAVPEAFTLGFAAYLFFTKPVIQKDGKYYGELNSAQYLIQDEQAEVFYKRWKSLSPQALVQQTLKDTEFWGADLNALPGFADSITDKLEVLMKGNIKGAIAKAIMKKVVVA